MQVVAYQLLAVGETDLTAAVPRPAPIAEHAVDAGWMRVSFLSGEAREETRLQIPAFAHGAPSEARCSGD